MKYIIMADGQGKRWNNHTGIPKHFIEVDGESLLARTVRLLHEHDEQCRIIITSHDPRYNIEGAVRYEPKNNHMEIDRFTDELIEDGVCFLYGDTYYSDKAISVVVGTPAEDLLFFGSERKIFAVKVEKSQLMREHIANVKKLFNEGKIKECIGWQLYQSFTGLPFDKKAIGENFVRIGDMTRDFDSPEDYKEFKGI